MSVSSQRQIERSDESTNKNGKLIYILFRVISRNKYKLRLSNYEAINYYDVGLL